MNIIGGGKMAKTDTLNIRIEPELKKNQHLIKKQLKQ